MEQVSDVTTTRTVFGKAMFQTARPKQQPLGQEVVEEELTALEQELLEHCIDSVTVFDEIKREQTQYKQIIRDCYSWLFQKKCKLVDAFALQNHL